MVTSPALTMAPVCASETSVYFYETPRRHISELPSSDLHSSFIFLSKNNGNILKTNPLRTSYNFLVVVCTEHAPKRVPCVSADLQCPAHRRSTLTSELRNIVSLPYTGRISVEAGFRLHTLPVNSAERTLFCPRAVRNIPKHRAV